eukprot:TRINITY_DN3801_c1_g1_i1.p1 TRINITY_DN3801_c1_g1~~TRINITY_DN3801_c1_g1_i1.p1  ORF type:complete len:426 (-),score=29.89 TRINITY_DN3801_c1_g1_i1:578-1810(-)
MKKFVQPLIVFLLISWVAFGRVQQFSQTSQNFSQPTYSQGQQQNLVQFISLNRHGDRTPIEKYSFEDYTWLWDSGKLTVGGMLTAFEIGQEYQTILGTNISPDDVQVYSTNYDRTVDTANSLLLGLFTTPNTQVSENNEAALKCRPDGGARSTPNCLAQCMNIKTHVPDLPPVEVDKQMILAIQQKDFCQGYPKWDKMLEQTPGYKYAQDETYADALNVVKKLSGDTSELCNVYGSCQAIGLKAVEGLWSNLQCAHAAGKTYVKSHSNDELQRLFNPVAEYLWHSQFSYSQGTQTGGILLKRIIDIFSARRNQSHEYQPVILFSGHDTSVFGLIAALGVTNEAHLPEFGAHITFALYQQQDEYNLEIRYDGEFLGVPGCMEGKCSLDSFLASMQDRTFPIESCEPTNVKM